MVNKKYIVSSTFVISKEDVLTELGFSPDTNEWKTYEPTDEDYDFTAEHIFERNGNSYFDAILKTDGPKRIE